MPTQRNLTLLTDLYQLTMAQSYFREQQLGDATFILFIRSYPLDRGYFVSAGLCDVLDYLENFAFDPAAIEYLARQKQFSDEFLRHLTELRFTGDVHALPEGTVFFADEPMVRITARIPAASSPSSSGVDSRVSPPRTTRRPPSGGRPPASSRPSRRAEAGSSGNSPALPRRPSVPKRWIFQPSSVFSNGGVHDATIRLLRDARRR